MHRLFDNLLYKGFSFNFMSSRGRGLKLGYVRVVYQAMLNFLVMLNKKKMLK